MSSQKEMPVNCLLIGYMPRQRAIADRTRTRIALQHAHFVATMQVRCVGGKPAIMHHNYHLVKVNANKFGEGNLRGSGHRSEEGWLQPIEGGIWYGILPELCMRTSPLLFQRFNQPQATKPYSCISSCQIQLSSSISPPEVALSGVSR